MIGNLARKMRSCALPGNAETGCCQNLNTLSTSAWVSHPAPATMWLLRRGAGAARRLDQGADGAHPDCARPQRRGKIVAAAGHRRPAHGRLRRDPLERPRRDAAAEPPARQGGVRLCAAGPRDLSATHRAREPDDRLRHAQTLRARHRRRDLFALPRSRRHARAAAAATSPAASSSSSPSPARW